MIGSLCAQVWVGGANKFIDSEFLWTIHRSLKDEARLNMVTDDEVGG